MNIKCQNYLFFNKKEVGSRRKILNIYKVKKKSYAGNVILRIYNYYFGDSKNVKREYEIYYSKEFSNYKDYLICRFNISNELADTISKENMNYVDLDWKGDQVGESFSYEDKLKEQFWRFVGGIKYEN